MSRSSRVLLRHFFVLQVLMSAFAGAISAQVMQGPTTIRQNVHHDVSLPLSEMVKNAPPPDLTVHEAEEMKHIPLPPGLSTLTEDPALQTLAPVTPSPAVGLSFEGLGQGQYGFGVQYIPPTPTAQSVRPNTFSG